ncbi:hypothetical protein TWF970_004362 [Orbilia oligospora]|uniref:BTB domain-containing protein n=1 Tax=Orbilia oligospora TaxID=2813651 RepID=A0A7C8RDG7_ORBOL|nr:hypothetical protein TWF970_004362 [Orbilia oligospora]
MTESKHADYQKFFQKDDYADIHVTLTLESPAVVIPMHQIIICTTSAYFKEACQIANIGQTGAKLLDFCMSVEAFNIISAWVYGFGEKSFKSESDICVIQDVLGCLKRFEMNEYDEMDELRAALLKHLFQLHLNTLTSEEDAYGFEQQFDVLKDTCDFALPRDHNLIKDLVVANIPDIRASGKWLNGFLFKGGSSLVASVLIEVYEQLLDSRT